jgi:hypothetical protein
MAHRDKLAAEIEAAEKEIYRNRDEKNKTQAPPVEHQTKPEELDDDLSTTNPELEPEPEDEVDEVTAEHDEAKGDDGAAKADEPEEWESRFKTYKAHADITISGLRRSLLAAQEENLTLRDQIDDLTKKFAKITSEKKRDISQIFSDEERDLIGEETLKAMQKYNDAMLESAVAPLKSELEKEREARKKEQSKAVEEEKKAIQNEFLATLAKIVPNYAELDRNPRWLAWMKHPDEVSGVPRETLFLRAQANGDVGRVAEFFKEWQRLQKPKDKLASKVTPVGKQGETKTPPQNRQKKQGLTLKQIDQFYLDVARGKFRNRPKAQQEMERMIDEHLRNLGMRRK